MLTDARSLTAGHVLEAQVAIVGAGPAGVTLALELARAGTKVLLLESGGRRGGEADPSQSTGVSTGDPYYPLTTTRVRGFAGTSNHWIDNGPFRARPLEAHDFVGRDDIADHLAWPVSRGQLDEYYRQAQRWCQLGEYDYTVLRWATPERPEAPFVGGRTETAIFKLAAAEVWANRYDEVVADPDIELVLHATVADVVLDPAGDRITGLEIRVAGGTTFTARADRVVLAAGGIENPRFLLAAEGLRAAPISRDLVGRYFMEHPQVRAGRLHLTDPDAIEALGLYRVHASADEPGVWIHAKVSPTLEVLRDQHVLGSTFFLTPVSHARAADATRSFVTIGHARTWRPRNPDLGAHVANVARHPGAVVRTAVDVLLRRRHGAPEVIQLTVMAEQAPNRESCVTLSSTRDALGMPLPDLAWRTTDLDRRTIRAGHQAIDTELRDAGLGHVEDILGDQRVPPEFKGGWHHMGTTRMAADPTEGVVDNDSRVHGLENLYVAGSSIFPTSGYANPTLTIIAMTLRLADHLLGRPGPAST